MQKTTSAHYGKYMQQRRYEGNDEEVRRTGVGRMVAFEAAHTITENPAPARRSSFLKHCATLAEIGQSYEKRDVVSGGGSPGKWR